MNAAPAVESSPFPPAVAPASPRAVASLALGVVGLALCGIVSPVAWWLAQAELRDIRDRLRPESGESLARVGQVLGIVGTLLIAPVLLVVLAVVFGLSAAFWFSVLGG